MSRRFLAGRRLLPLVLCLPLLQLALPVRGAPGDVAAICESAAEMAARESGVPLDVLRAISLTETGRQRNGGFRPWPWTVNMEGVGKWFDNAGAARAYVDRHFARGARSFDVGCFQINYKWHGRAFSSIDEMFDPITNARYAARFLTELYAEFGDWSRAAGAYHSRTPRYARRYVARFDRIRAGLPERIPVTLARADPAADRIAVGEVRRNRFPLLQPGPTRSAASLVPLSGAVPMRLIEPGAARPLVETR